MVAVSGRAASSATSSSPSCSAVRCAISSIGDGASWRSTSQRSAFPRIQVAFGSSFSRSTVSRGHAPGRGVVAAEQEPVRVARVGENRLEGGQVAVDVVEEG